MEPDEVAQVLTKASAYDLRTIGRADVAAWHEILHAVELVDALEAVGRHYRVETRRAMPADILRHSRDAKRDRVRHDRARCEPLALPSRYETDTARAARVRAHIADASAQIRKPATPKPHGPRAIETLRQLTAGPDWPNPEDAA